MDKKEATMQEHLQSIDEHIGQLENEDVSLEDSFKIYEEGMRLIKECNDKIDYVEKKVLELNANGTLQEME